MQLFVFHLIQRILNLKTDLKTDLKNNNDFYLKKNNGLRITKRICLKKNEFYEMN